MAHVTSTLPSSNGGGGSITHNATLLKQGGDEELNEFYHLSKEDYDGITDLLYPELFPFLVNPSSVLIFNKNGLFEVGVIIPHIIFVSTLIRGTITPAYGTSGFRSGLPTQHNFTGVGLTNIPTSDTDVNTSIYDYEVLSGVNSWSNSISYSEGEQPLSNKGNNYNTPFPAGTTSNKYVSLTGIHPIFYGKSALLPIANQTLIDGGTKQVEVSTGTVTITFGASVEYIWFAIPQSSTDKTKWYVDALNNGNIGSPSDLFDNDSIVNIDSPTVLWNGIPYRIYISNYPTSTSGSMQLQN